MDGIFDKVKTSLSKAKNEAGKYSKVAIQKTTNIVSQTKYSFAVNDAENKIVAVMAEIGEYVYNEYLQGAEFPEDIAEKCGDIDRLKEEIASLKDKIADLKDATVCRSCGEYNSSDNIYCAKCGTKLKEDEAESQTAEVELEPEPAAEPEDAE